MPGIWRNGARRLVLAALAGGTMAAAPAQSADRAALDALVAAYPADLERIDGRDLVWRDGTRMAIDDGTGEKSFERWLAAPDIKDMVRYPYPAGTPLEPPPQFDPGRARHQAFFDKMYGDCRQGTVGPQLVEIEWLPKKWGRRLQITRVNGVADKLAAVSAALDALPAEFDIFLRPPAGTYHCRRIAGTNRISAHGHGIAIDIATARADYWRWIKPDAQGQPRWRNRIPREIVAIFEAHGFIWGGRWSHVDTMHFEYRPELLPPAR